jgi:hypothetical protein
VYVGIQDDGKSPEKFFEFCTTYTIVRILSSVSDVYKVFSKDEGLSSD